MQGEKLNSAKGKKSPTDSPLPVGDEGNGMGELEAHLIGIFMQTWCQGMIDRESNYLCFTIKAWRSFRSSAEIPENWTPIPETEELSSSVATVFQMTFADILRD